MYRGIWITGESLEEARDQLLDETSEIRIVSAREIDLSGLPELRSGPLPRHWVFVYEHEDPDVEARLPHHEDPEGECERGVRQMYLSMAIKPDLLLTGQREGFTCPACEANVWFDLPPPREHVDSNHRDCPECGTHLHRDNSGDGRWTVFIPPSKPEKLCIFCGARADSMEHVIPAWISKRLGIKEIIEMDGSIQIGRKPRTQPISFASYRARIFCSECNTYFHHLEDEVIPLLVPMARGVVMSLGAESQGLLARWAVKTAIALLSAQPEDHDMVPLLHRTALRHENKVVADTWVGFFRWHGGTVMVNGQGLASNSKAGAWPLRTYSALLAFEGLGFYVTAFDEPLPRGKTLEGDRPPMLSFMPTRSDLVHWPPPLTDNRMLPGLMNWTPLRG